MRQILAFTRKELLQWAQRPGSWIIVFVVPFVFIAVMQAVFGSSGTPVVTLYAVNSDKGSGGQRVMEALRASSQLKIEALKTREDADKRVGSGDRMAAIVVPEDFSEDLKTPAGARLEIIVDPARAEQANIVTGLVNAALGPLMVDMEVTRGVETGIDQVMQSLQTGSGDTQPQPTERVSTTPQPTSTPDPMRKFFTAALKGVVSSQVQETLDNPQVQLNEQPIDTGSSLAARQPSLLDYLVPGYALMFVFFLISNLAVTVIEERQTGTLRRLLVAPVPRSQILLGKMIPYFLIAVVQFVTVLGFSKLVFNIDFGSDPGRVIIALGAVIVASALAMSTLGILIAAFSRTEGQADGLAIVLILAMAVVSGAMFPSISIPGLKMITPHYWALQGFLNVIARGQGLEGVLLPTGVLLTMSALCFTIGAIRFRFE